MTEHSFTNPTRRPSTIRAYLKRAEELRLQAHADLNIPPTQRLDPRQIVGWLAKKKITYSASTWRQYKSAMICSLENELDLLDERLDPTPWAEAIEMLRNIVNEGDGVKDGGTSAKKLKKFPQSDFTHLDTYLKSKPHQTHEALRDWLQSGIWTGLRPVEWRDCELIDINGIPALLVQNAKHSNGRAHGKTRTVILQRFTPEELETLKRHLARVHKWYSAGIYDRMYHACSSKLYTVVRKLWPKRTRHLTLYSTRHQFVADAKASNFSLIEIAALMGHAVDETASEHYGKRAAGQQITKVQALAAEMAKIKQQFQGYPDRRMEDDPPIPDRIKKIKPQKDYSKVNLDDLGV